MKIRVKLVGLPHLQARLGVDPVNVELDGSTVGDLLRWLQRIHGDPSRTRLLDASGRLDPDMVVLRNGRQPVSQDVQLSEGDQLTLVVVVAGG